MPAGFPVELELAEALELDEELELVDEELEFVDELLELELDVGAGSALQPVNSAQINRTQYRKT